MTYSPNYCKSTSLVHCIIILCYDEKYPYNIKVLPSLIKHKNDNYSLFHREQPLRMCHRILVCHKKESMNSNLK